ncbi:MAG: FGGY-family carbohydrate kinase [Bacilli bacterium]
MEAFLGIDVGSTNVKAQVYSIGGESRPVSMSRTPVNDDPVVGPYHDPEAIWDAVVRCIRTCVDDATAIGWHIVSVAVASFGEEIVLLDAAGEALGPVIPWFAQVPETVMNDVHRFAVDLNLRVRTGLPIDRSFTLSKWVWLSRVFPDVWERAHTWLPMADYIAARLCGEVSASSSLASRTLAYSPFDQTWLDDVFAALQIDRPVRPALVVGGSALGAIRSSVRSSTGLSTDAIACAGGHDLVCSALGVGVTQSGQALLSSGTAEAVYVIADKRAGERGFESADDSVCVGRVANAETIYFTDFLPTGTLLLWAQERILGAPGLEATSRSLTEALNTIGNGDLPAFWFERTPLSLGDFGFRGLRVQHGREHLYASVVQALGQALRLTVDRLEELISVPVRQLRACGALAQLPGYVKWKSDLLGRSLRVDADRELTAYGAAKLAACGVGRELVMSGMQEESG